jgi:AmiR/NasT family two-component response regulator
MAVVKAKANGVDQASAVKRRVLIVEDDLLVGMGLKAQLERLGHSVVGQASRGPEALALYREQKPDVVLLDIRLDDADGIEVAGELLKERRAPMIIISAYSDKELIDRASAAGVFGYLIKPANAEALQAQMEVAVRRFEEHERPRSATWSRRWSRASWSSAPRAFS